MMIRLHPLHDLGTLSRQIDRAFEEIGSFERHPRSVKSNIKSDWLPNAELIDSPDNLTLRVYLPGVDAKEIDIKATKESVVIAGDRPYPKNTDDRRYWSEFSYGKFRRAFSLPVPVAHDRIEADYKDGILTLTLPKVNAVSQTIKVQLNGQVPPATANVAEDRNDTDRTDAIAA